MKPDAEYRFGFFAFHHSIALWLVGQEKTQLLFLGFVHTLNVYLEYLQCARQCTNTEYIFIKEIIIHKMIREKMIK
jgi:hypothetical protein